MECSSLIAKSEWHCLEAKEAMKRYEGHAIAAAFLYFYLPIAAVRTEG